MELAYTALFITLLPAILSIVKWSSLNASQRWFAVMLWFFVVVSFAGRIWTIITHGSNLPFFYIYIIGEYLMLLQVFRLMFDKKIKDSTWLNLAIIFTFLWLINVSTGNGWWEFPDYIRAVEIVIIVTIIIYWFLEMLKDKIILHPYKTFEFWFCSGLFIYLCGNFLLFVFPKVILNSGKEVFLAIWKVNVILNILLYLMYTVALLWVKRKVK